MTYILLVLVLIAIYLTKWHIFNVTHDAFEMGYVEGLIDGYADAFDEEAYEFGYEDGYDDAREEDHGTFYLSSEV